MNTTSPALRGVAADGPTTSVSGAVRSAPTRNVGSVKRPACFGSSATPNSTRMREAPFTHSIWRLLVCPLTRKSLYSGE